MFSTNMDIDKIKQMEPDERQEFIEWLISRPSEDIDRLFHCLQIRQYMIKTLNSKFVGQTTSPNSNYTIWSSTSSHIDHVHVMTI